MRRTSWGAISLVVILGLGLAVAGCDGPSRGPNTQPSSASGFLITITTNPNIVRAANPDSTSQDGGASVVQAKVFDRQGNLVDGAEVLFTTTLGVFRVGTQDFVGIGVTTNRGLATVGFVAQDQVGTALITATVEDASVTTRITIF
jgi:hypothetical protein